MKQGSNGYSRLPFILAAALLTLLASITLAQAADSIPRPGPTLDPVPGPEMSHVGLPGAAAWPVLRYERPLRLLAILPKSESAAPYQRIARRLRASLELRYVGEGEDFYRYHVNDKWIEPTDNPTMKELIAELRKVAGATIGSGDPRTFDVIFLHHKLPDLSWHDNLIRFIKSGGVVAACGNIYPPADSPLGKLWPAQATPKSSWMYQGARRAAGPELAGVPLDYAGGWTYIPLARAAEGATALATGEAGAMFKRQVDSGTLLFVPTGPLSRKHDAIASIGRKYDHDEIWLRAWDQVLCALARGQRAIPAYGDIQAVAKQALPGQPYTLSAKLLNRSHQSPLATAVHVTTPQGKVVYAREEKHDLPPGQEKSISLDIPVASHWGAGMYAVYLTIGDPVARKQFHQAMEYIPVTGLLAISLHSDKPGYPLGEEAQLKVTASALSPWKGSLRLGVYDFRGRLLGVEEKAVQLTAEKQDLQFHWRLTDHGVRTAVFWAEVAAVAGGQEFGRAETKFNQHELWSMRNEYQWSTWAGVACGPPSVVPAGMRLMGHAGMNALGYPGRRELYYPAERWGWRYYNENIGVNTFSPVIEYVNEKEIEEALEKEAKVAPQNRDLTSAAFVLGSVGEEAGFKKGWGTRYYWDEPVAPEKACQAFRWFLHEKYGPAAGTNGLDRLNQAWNTRYRSWEEVKLTKEFSASGTVKLEADGWAHPKESPLGEGATAVSLAPYQDTAQFYNWYYDKIVDIARRLLRERINPVTLAMSSAPTIGSGEYDVRQSGPSAWNESQWHSIMDGPEPGFGLIWGHFDWSVMTDNMFWGFLLARSGHNNYWVDIPLMFNNDLTHTRASFAMRQWTHRFAGHERIVLDSRPFVSEVGVLRPNGLSTSVLPPNMVTSLQVALSQGGFGLPQLDPAQFSSCKIVFAVERQAIMQSEADRLNAYVAGGGTLVFTPRLATQTALGLPQPTTPGCGLAEKWNVRLTPPSAAVPKDGNRGSASFGLDSVSDSLKELKMAGAKAERDQVQQEGWTTLAAYEDGSPAIFMRRYGQGRLVCLNAMYQSHWYIQSVTPTGVGRQGFYRLVEWLCAEAGARRTLRIDGDLNQTLHMAVKQFTDPTGKIGYVIVRTSGEVPWTAGTLRWLGPQTTCYDVLGGPVGKPALRLGKEIALNLQPGAGRVLAFVSAPIESIHLAAQPLQFTVGQPLELKADILDTVGHPVPGSFPLKLRVEGPDGELAGLRRSFSAQSGTSVKVSTALNDPAGDWTITITDGISGLTGSARVRVAASEVTAQAPGFVPWGQPSEVWEPAVLSTSRFVDCLSQLAALYQKDHSAESWMTKQRLGYYYDLFPGTRHDLLRALNDADWPSFASAIRRAVMDGQTLILTGEDVGIHPGSGLSPYAHHDGGQMAALATALKEATWSVITRDGDTIAASLGRGRLILCRESIDAAGNTNPELARWQKRWLEETDTRSGQPVPTPGLNVLLAWWVGAEPILSTPRTVSWFAGNHREIKLKIEDTQPLGATFTFLLPPTGRVQEMALNLSAKDEGNIRFDVGCDGQEDGSLAIATSTATDPGELTRPWSAAANRYLDWAAAHGSGPGRDGSGWRLVPVRVTATGKAELMLSQPKVVVQ